MRQGGDRPVIAKAGEVEEGQQRRVAVVVVHGVGDNLPGTTVNDVCRSLCAKVTDASGVVLTNDRRLFEARANELFSIAEPRSPLMEARALEDGRGSRPGAAPAVFPVFSRRVEFENGSATFHELYWADLARSGTNLWATVRGFARLVFEIPHVVDAFLRDAPGWLPFLLRRLILLACCFVRGPIAGYAIVMLIGALSFVSFSWIPDREDVAALLGLMPERGSGLLSFLPAAMRPGEGAGESLARWNNWHTIVAITAGIGLLTTAAAVASRRSPARRTALGVASLASAIYLLDMVALRQARYELYAGFVYLDYLCLVLLMTAAMGLLVFRRRRLTEAGFADLALSASLWSIVFLVQIISEVGNALLSTHVLEPATPKLPETKITSSQVHYLAFAVFYPYLSYLWALWGLLMALAIPLSLVVFLTQMTRWGSYYRGIFAALALVMMQATVILTVMPALAILHIDDTLCRDSRNYATVRQPVGCHTRLQFNREALDLLHSIQLLEASAAQQFPSSLRDRVAKAVQDRFPRTLNFDMTKALKEQALSFVWHGLVVVLVGGIAVMVALYRHVRTRLARPPYDKPLRLPRLIVNAAVLMAILVLGTINVALSLAWVGILDIDDFLPETIRLRAQDVELPSEVVQMAVFATSALLALTRLPQLATPLSGVLQIMQGLIDHHYRPQVGLANRLMLRKQDAARQALLAEALRREHIQRRLRAIVDETIVGKGFTDIVFLAHSQGTVIVFDFLRAEAARIALRSHVVTVGSPLGHLYSYYFNEYGDLFSDFARMEASVASWTNMYRTDDAIAGPMMPRVLTGLPETLVSRLPFGFREVRLPPGGHLHYWREPIVCDQIRDVILG